MNYKSYNIDDKYVHFCNWWCKVKALFGYKHEHVSYRFKYVVTFPANTKLSVIDNTKVEAEVINDKNNIVS